MKKKIKSEMDDDLRPEYDLRQLLKNSVRGKYYKSMQQGYTIKIHKSDGTTVVKHVKPANGAVMLAPDVLEYFPDAEAVNKALRSLIALIPNQRRTAAKKERKSFTRIKNPHGFIGVFF